MLFNKKIGRNNERERGREGGREWGEEERGGRGNRYIINRTSEMAQQVLVLAK